MTTLYIRDVPETVADTLKKRAASEGKSLSVFVAGELVKLAARPTNAEVVARLKLVDRTGAPTTDDIVDAIEVGRR